MNQPQDDRMVFAEDKTPLQTEHGEGPAWKVLVVDDDRDVHHITSLVLSAFRFENLPVLLHHASTVAEAEEKLREVDDLAVIFLDVVMESEDAGLRLARRIRDVHQNQAARIVLRTGQPGKAPELKVITELGINDYREKTELTTTRLFATLTAALRSYKQIRELARQRDALEAAIRASSRLIAFHNAREFAACLIQELCGIFDLCFGEAGRDGVVVAVAEEGRSVLLADPANLHARLGGDAYRCLPEPVVEHLRGGRPLPATFFATDHFAALATVDDIIRLVVVIRGPTSAGGEGERRLVRAFAAMFTATAQSQYLAHDLRHEFSPERMGGRRISTARISAS